jgi:exonuclease SbcC
MIPVKLALRNFMCYRDNIPPISFEGIHTACISGNNGNGKSALVDAITWALWGQTRAISDDDLVHSGQTEAEVDFEFTVGPQSYRIIRKHSKPKNQKSSGQTILEFQIVTPDGYKILTGDTVTQTQQKIIQILRMDYDTFINSAFLKQGRADEFTKKRPGDRKQVLANILQLSAYDELEEQAKNLYKEQEFATAQLEISLKNLQEELSFKPVFEAELEKSLVDLLEADKLVRDRELKLSVSRKEIDTLENKKSLLSEIIVHIQDTEHNFNLWNTQAQQCRSRVQEYEYLITKRTEIEAQYTQYLIRQKLFQEADQKFKQINALTQSKHRLEMSVIKAMEELNRSHAVEESRLRELEITAGNLPKLQGELQQIIGQLKLLDEEDIKLQEKRENSKLQ